MKKKIKNVFGIAIGTTLSQFIVFLGAILIARIYSPNSIGEYASIVAFSTILAPLLTRNREVKIVVVETDNEANTIKNKTIIEVIFIVCFFEILIFMCNSVFSSLISKEFYPLIMLVMPLAAILGIFNILQQLLIRKSAFYALSLRGIFQNLITVISQIFLSLFVINSIGLLLSELIGRFTAIAWIEKRILQIKSSPKNPEKFQRIEMQKNSTKNDLWNSISGLFDTLNSNILILVTTYLYGVFQVGILAIAVRIAFTPLGVVSTALGQVFLADVSKSSRSQKSISSKTYRESFLLVSVVALTICIFVGLFIKFAFKELDLQHSDQISRVVIVMLPLIFFQLLWNTFGSLYYISGLWKEFSLASVSRFVLILVIALTCKEININFEVFLKIYIVTLSIVISAMLAFVSKKMHIKGIIS